LLQFYTSKTTWEGAFRGATIHFWHSKKKQKINSRGNLLRLQQIYSDCSRFTQIAALASNLALERGEDFLSIGQKTKKRPKLERFFASV
jgi:hypothetical protein